MSNNIYDILNKLKSITDTAASVQITESADADITANSPLAEKIAELEAQYTEIKEAREFKSKDEFDNKAQPGDWYHSSQGKVVKTASGVRHERGAAKDDSEELDEGSNQKPDFLDIDNDGNKTEPMKKAAKDAKKSVDDSASTKYVKEVAPPGAKAERMVKHIKKGYADDGKLTKREKGIAYATAWKAHNKGQVEEGVEFGDTIKNSQAKMTKVKKTKVTEGAIRNHPIYTTQEAWDHYAKELAEQEAMEGMTSHVHEPGISKPDSAQPVTRNVDVELDEIARLAGLPIEDTEITEVAPIVGMAAKAAIPHVASAMHDKITADESYEMGEGNDFEDDDYFDEVEMQGWKLIDPGAANGTSFVGEFSHKINPADVFGPPNSNGDGYKVTQLWVIEFIDGTIATIYDYKGDKWHVGGHSKRAYDNVMEELRNAALSEDAMGEGNEFSGALAKAKAAGEEEFTVDGKTYPVKENVNVSITADEDDAMMMIRKLAGLDIEEKVEKDVFENEELSEAREFKNKEEFDKYAKTGDWYKTSQGKVIKTDSGIKHERGLSKDNSEELDEDRDIEHANTPREKVAPLSAAIPSGDDMHRAKKSYSDKPYQGDNPMAVNNELEESLWKKYSTMIGDFLK